MSAGTAETTTCSVRVISIYATRWRHRGHATRETQLDLKLGRLKDFYDFYKDQLPRLLVQDTIEVADVGFPSPVAGAEITQVSSWLFALPSYQVVAALALDFTTRPLAVEAQPTAEVLERCIHAQLRIRGKELPEYVRSLADSVAAEPIETEQAELLPERHQLVFVPRLTDDEEPLGDSVIEEIVYRDAPPYREEFTKLQKPEELNQPGRTLGRVTPYASLLYGHKDFVEDSVFLSTVHAVGTASRFRQIWHDAYRQVRAFREDKQKEGAGEQVREDLEVLADNLGNLEFDLTFSVEFPLMRIESFHSALYEAMDLPSQAVTLSQMFTQLAGSVRSEITAIDIRERRTAESKQKWNAIAASVLSFIGVPVGFVVAFFGINARQVRSDRSIFDHHYLAAYVVALCLALIPVGFILFPYVRGWRRKRNLRPHLA